MPTETSFLFIVFIVALLYSTVGHGGASGYIAIMVMFSVPFISIKPVALLLNIIVSSLAFILYFQSGYFKFRLFWPLITTSIPTAFAGGYLKINQPLVNNILAIALMFSCIRLVIRNKKNQESESCHEVPVYLLMLFGTGIGFLSGMLGIGGGIILSPVLILFRLTNAREAAALSAPFILVNSISGLSAFTLAGGVMPHHILPMIMAVVLGGLLGGMLGSRKFSLYGLRVILSVTVTFAAIKLISF